MPFSSLLREIHCEATLTSPCHNRTALYLEQPVFLQITVQPLRYTAQQSFIDMSLIRATLKLPRVGARLLETRIPPTPLAVVNQRRWLRKPPPRDRAWAERKAQEDQDRRDQEAAHQIPKEPAGQEQQQPQGPGLNTQLASTLSETNSSDLVSEVHIPADPHGVLPPDHPALAILGNSSLVIQRQIEMMNIIIGFEQANRYIMMDGQGNTIGYIAEQDHGMGSSMARQVFKTHRSFTTHIFDRYEREVLRIHRPFAYINSKIRIYDPVPEGGYGELETSTALQGTSTSSVMNQGAVAQVSPLKLDEMRIIGEAQQRWAPLRRKYDLFSYRPLTAAPENDNTPRLESGDKPTSETTALTESKAPEQAIEAGMTQFAHINEPFLSWDFTLRSETNETIGSVNRNFAGFAREIFTDTGVYALRMDSAAQTSALESAEGKEVGRYVREATGMTLDQRAVMLASAVSIDFDYFSRHSSAGSGGMGFMPLWFPGMGGGAAAEGGAAAGGVAGAAGEAGAIEGAAGAAGRGLGTGAGASAIAGAGTMAGYEAMQRGAYGPRGGDDASPQAGGNEPYSGASPDQPGQGASSGEDAWGESSDPWGESSDPWGGNDGQGGGPPPSAGGEGGEGGGGWGDMLSDFLGGD
jgi:hypothetical protein